MSATTVTITLTAEQLFQIDQGLDLRISYLANVAERTPNDPYWAEQLEQAKAAAKVVAAV